MSRIGRQPITVPDKVDVTLDGNHITVKGPLGTLSRTVVDGILVEREGNVLSIKRETESRQHRSLHGLSRTLVANMVTGVHQGFVKELELVGVGYRAQAQGNKLTLTLGYSHPIEIEVPAGVEVKVDANTKISLKGPDKQLIGDLAALIRSKRPPEPYKGKGVKYKNEVIRRKAGKAGKK
jgi:large subunit ribosomal protein L6